MSTSGRSRTGARRFILAISAALLLLATGAASAHAALVGSPPDRLQVWNYNTHRMDKAGIPDPDPNDPLRTDYRVFLDRITNPSQVPYYPDIITLQEAGTNTPNLQTATCHDLEHELEVRTYPQDYNCFETTETGGAAVVYRTARLQLDGAPVKKQMLSRPDPTQPCAPGGWYAAPVRLQDTGNGKHVNVAAVHLANGGNDCAWDNVQSLTTRLGSDTNAGGLGSNSMQIMAGDWNHADATATNSNNTFSAWYCWYLGAHVDGTNCNGVNLGWKDPMFRQCKDLGLTTDADKYSCLHIYHWTWTFGQNVHDRRDFLFTKTYAIANQVTIDSYPNPTQFSDHRAQGALLTYY